MTNAESGHAVFIDPSSEDFLGDRLFDLENKPLNRDDTLLPFARLRQHLAALGIDIHTADYLMRGKYLAATNHYWSIGLLNRYRELINRPHVRLRGFMLFEPPLVAPRMYRALPELTRVFEEVYVHNLIGDGYSLKDVNFSRLRKLFWPQPYNHVVEPFWSRKDRLNKVVVIAGNHNPKMRKPEYYSKRIEAVVELAKFNAVDLYGHGWDRWWSKQSMWPTYWRHRRDLMRIYRGRCESKLEILSRYQFSLCLENMPMYGFVTEKIFDCLYAGTIPLYLGAPDIENYIPPAAFIDINKYYSWAHLLEGINTLSKEEMDLYRLSGKNFLNSQSQDGNGFFGWLSNVISHGLRVPRPIS